MLKVVSVNPEQNSNPFSAAARGMAAFLFIAAMFPAAAMCWEVQTPVGSNSGSKASLALDGSGSPRIAYADSSYQIKYVEWTGVAWSSQPVDAQEFWGHHT